MLTLPFASAYFAAYPGFDVPPFWVAPLKPVLAPALGFADRITVYNVYGRVFNAVYLLFLPAAFALRRLQEGRGWQAGWGGGLTVAGLLAAAVGVAGDYWLDGAGFLLEFCGLLIMNLGALLSGLAGLRAGGLPRGLAWLLTTCFPGLFAVQFLIGHIPSSPTLLFAVAWLALGHRLQAPAGQLPNPSHADQSEKPAHG
ncbi:MAG: hypothetical protein JNK29_04950 [Anaerolineales bacterium]|nr:hypothetical protein [Anaerolineales bacterium]